MTGLAGIWVLAIGLLGCEGSFLEETACDRYADYMCDCHPEDDCAGFLDLAATADADTVDQCAADLADKRAADANEGLECPV
jgi:hypothetical protein